jgi:hypothetical protein
VRHGSQRRIKTERRHTKASARVYGFELFPFECILSTGGKHWAWIRDCNGLSNGVCRWMGPKRCTTDVTSFRSTTREIWVAQATAAGQPLAQADTALKLFTQQALQATRLAGAAPNPGAPPTIDSQQSPRQLLRMAVESRDPEVLFTIGEAQGYLHWFLWQPNFPSDYRAAGW